MPLLRSTFHDNNDSLMPKLRLIGLLYSHLARLPSHTLKKRAMFRRTEYLGPQRSGRSLSPRGHVNAGEEVTLLQTDANTNYAQ